jgi:hypothetical protein
LTTNASGWTTIEEIIDYVNVGGIKSYYSNFTIYAVNNSYSIINHTYNVTVDENNLKDVFTFDTTSPELTIIYPLNNLNYNVSRVNFNVSINEPASWCGISISGSENETMTFNSSNTEANYTNTSIADGNYSFVASCNDSSNNFGFSDIYNFLIDTGFIKH